MRGDDAQQAAMFSYLSPEERVPADHPLRRIRTLVDQALHGLSPRFSTLYASTGRPSVAPEKLLRALLLQVLYSVRSERMLMEQLNYNLLFRWFVGLNMDDAVWDVTVFTKNRERLLAGDIAQGFFEQVLALARTAHLLSDEHFTVDGTLIEAWAGQKSFKRKDAPRQPPQDGPRNPAVDFHDERRANDTHQSSTDPDCRLYRKSNGAPALLCYVGNVMMENRHGLSVSGRLNLATGTAERDAGLDMVQDIPGNHRATLGGDKNYDTRRFVDGVRSLKITPHVAQNNTRRRSAIDRRTTRQPGYAVSMQKRKRIEEIFGWLKTVGLLRKTRYRGRPRVAWMFVFGLAAYNLVRMRSLIPAG